MATQIEGSVFPGEPRTADSLREIGGEWPGGLPGRTRSYATGTMIARENWAERQTGVLLSGWAAVSRSLADGKIQIIDFRLPGDLINTCGDLGRATGADLLLLTDVTIHDFMTPVEALLRQGPPRFCTMLLGAMSRDEAVIAERLVSVGRRNAAARTAHLLLELGARLRRIGFGDGARFTCPLTQTMLADALGLSGIHLNRVLRRLREQGLVRFHDALVEIDDLDGLIALAEFDAAYLEQASPF